MHSDASLASGRKQYKQQMSYDSLLCARHFSLYSYTICGLLSRESIQQYMKRKQLQFAYVFMLMQ